MEEVDIRLRAILIIAVGVMRAARGQVDVSSEVGSAALNGPLHH